jgi:hypothetical protein
MGKKKRYRLRLSKFGAKYATKYNLHAEDAESVEEITLPEPVVEEPVLELKEEKEPTVIVAPEPETLKAPELPKVLKKEEVKAPTFKATKKTATTKKQATSSKKSSAASKKSSTTTRKTTRKTTPRAKTTA